MVIGKPITAKPIGNQINNKSFHSSSSSFFLRKCTLLWETTGGWVWSSIWVWYLYSCQWPLNLVLYQAFENLLTRSFQESIMEKCSVAVKSKSYGVTIQIKPLWQFFCMVPFDFNILQNKIWDLFWFVFATLEIKG